MVSVQMAFDPHPAMQISGVSSRIGRGRPLNNVDMDVTLRRGHSFKSIGAENASRQTTLVFLVRALEAGIIWEGGRQTLMFWRSFQESEFNDVSSLNPV